MKKSLSMTSFNQMMKMNDRTGVLSIVGSLQANKSLEETEYNNTFVVNGSSMGYTFGDDDRPERILKSIISSTSVFLSDHKTVDENTATALVLTDTAGNFKFAAIVEYHANENNSDEPGNWSYVMTFNEKDLSELESKKKVNKLLYGDTAFQSICDKVSYDVAAISFQQDHFMYDACLLLFDTIHDVLDAEAKEGEVVDIEIPGYITASVAVENDKKVFSIVPDGHQKNLIKDDSKLEI